MRYPKVILISLSLLLFPAFVFARERAIAFYAVRPTLEAPVLDGVLNDRVWTLANRGCESYEYFKADPGPGELPIDFRMLYDDKGVYVGIVNHDSNVEKIKAQITARDDPNLYTDDCVEVYFDPVAQGIGYVKFTVNFLGTRGDLKQLDGANPLPSWNPEGWQVKTAKGKIDWTIEMFLPWSTVEKKPTAGDVWMFDLVRYAYSSGRFQGATWSPGGSYMTPSQFGYLYFQGPEAIAPEKLVGVLADKIPAPWQLRQEKGIVFCERKGQGSYWSFEQVCSNRNQRINDLIESTSSLIKDLPSCETVHKIARDLTDLHKTLRSLPKVLPEQIRALDDLGVRAENLYWEARIESLFAKNSGNK